MPTSLRNRSMNRRWLRFTFSATTALDCSPGSLSNSSRAECDRGVMFYWLLCDPGQPTFKEFKLELDRWRLMQKVKQPLGPLLSPEVRECDPRVVDVCKRKAQERESPTRFEVDSEKLIRFMPFDDHGRRSRACDSGLRCSRTLQPDHQLRGSHGENPFMNERTRMVRPIPEHFDESRKGPDGAEELERYGGDFDFGSH